MPLAFAFLVRAGIVAAWLVAVIALVTPVTADAVECGPAIGYVLGIEGASRPAGLTSGEAKSKCLRHTVSQVAGAVVLAGSAVVVMRPLLRRIDPAAGL
jgi:hypothetical protein